jgi:phosphoketolase
MKRLFTQFSFPGGIPSHVAPETPGSIHEGGELGYAVSHAYGAAFDNPDLIVACVIGDGEAETGPLATSWHSNKFLNPATDGVVLPILHLNGYKIANPCILARISHEEQRRHSIISILRPTIFDCHVAAFDVAALAQTAPDRSEKIGERVGRPTPQNADDWHRWLLRAHCKRPSSRHATECCNKVAPPHGLAFSPTAAPCHVV